MFLNQRVVSENFSHKSRTLHRTADTFPYFFRFAFVCILFLLFSLTAFPQSKFEDRRISNVIISFEGTDRSTSSAAEFEVIARNALGNTYSAVRVRNALAALFQTNNIVNASVEARETANNSVDLRFIIKRKTRADRILIEVGNAIGEKDVTEQELLLRVNILNSGTAITEQTLRDNADLILDYLRDRGFFNAEVTYKQQPLRVETQVAVTFNVNPNTQAKVEKFDINIEGFDASKLREDLKLKPGEFYSREKLNEDVEKIKEALRKENFLAPELDEPRIVLDDNQRNLISIELSGKVGATVNVSVETANPENKKEADEVEIGNKKQTELLPIKREGTVDFAAIIEGERRLKNYYQEQGYFFANVTSVCSVTPPFTEAEASVTLNETQSLCSALGGAELAGRTVAVKYRVDLNRQLKLTDIRIEGTSQFTVEEVQSVLDSQEANILGFIPLFGYGRGYTSEELIRQDQTTIASLMRELGFRNASVSVRRGVSITGEELILTFVVDEGVPTRINNVKIEGNKEISEATLQSVLPNLTGKNFSRARARNGVKSLAEYYSNQGYYDARITYAVEELPDDGNTQEDLVNVVYKVDNEGKKVFVNRVFVNGNEMTKDAAILKTATIKPDRVLRAADIFSTEQNLYSTSAFKRVEVRPEPAGTRSDGNRQTDVIINVEEEKPRLITYGGGFSTDEGPFGFFDIRHYNLFGNLFQGGARVRIGRRQQLAQIDFLNPRFWRDGTNKDGSFRYSPLTFTAQYQRDSTVTRFFRSTFDKGTFGIVQRVDENGNPIDEFGAKTGSPTINRLTLSAETSRTISQKNRSILFARYRFEDVRLYNINSLLIKDLLLPDAKIRISGFGATFVRDTRENCNIKYSVLDIIAKGEPGEPCRYNAGDPTRGDYLTAEYNVSLPALGANIGFSKFQASYNYYYTLPQFKNTTFAGRAILGLANVFSKGQRFSSAQFPDLDGILPISERFFAGGSTTLRGFEFESAGPRVVIVPQGFFRNSKGDPVFLQPFSIPFGGNALAIVNLEARVPLTKSVRAVPFYDGGNVFRKVGDIFNPPDVPDSDVFRRNLRALWSHTVGLGFRIKTPVGGEFGVDYGYLLNPPRFLIPQPNNAPNAIFQVRQGQVHFRFSQAF
ncbi:MAG: BamA/TamA family outer membrane protein [Pyrinomonadaceae bacterium]|nr:BamA/TamA family outer membrane protein [Pyrinomonadaceae bacterium]